MIRIARAFGWGIGLFLLVSGDAHAVGGCDQDAFVHVTASVPTIAEGGGGTAQFVFAVDIPGTANLTLAISGTATNGVDYQELPTHVALSALDTQVALALIPAPDALSEGAETVTVTMTGTDNPCVHVGFPDSATISIVAGSDLQWDVFWRNSDGTNAIWQFTGPAATELTAAFPPGVPTSWQPIGTGDVNGDGISDVVWLEAATGQVAIWLMGSPATIGSATFPANLGAGLGWALAGIGDLDGDARADLVWRNGATGELVVWYMSAAGVIASSRNYGTVPLSYELRGVGDLNADGIADLLWFQPADGQVAIWLMAGNGAFTGAFPGAVGAGAWRPYRVGDFDGDGRADILWRNEASGLVAAWYLDGGILSDFDFFVSVPIADWQVGSVGDFDLDGRADLIWYAPASGDVVRWMTNGRHIAPSFEPLPSVGTGWQIVP